MFQMTMKKTAAFILPCFIVTSFVIALFFPGCKKDNSLVPDNDAPYYKGLSSVLVQNYINRLFIDLIGREPTDSEMIHEFETFRAADLGVEERVKLITKLQTDTNHIPGDSSYKYAYYNRFYELCKARV